MSKRNRDRREERETGGGGNGGGRSEGGIEWVSTIVATVAIGLAFYVWTDARSIKKSTSTELATLEGRVSQLAAQVAAVQKPAAPQGLDPNKVYTVKLDGAPIKGNATAPIVIAEFSDYQ